MSRLLLFSYRGSQSPTRIRRAAEESFITVLPSVAPQSVDTITGLVARCRAAQVALKVRSDVLLAIAHERAQLHIGTALPKQSVAAHACYAALRDACVLMLVEKGF